MPAVARFPSSFLTGNSCVFFGGVQITLRSFLLSLIKLQVDICFCVFNCCPQQRKIKNIPHKGCVWSGRVAIELEKKWTSYQIFSVHLQLTGVDVRISGCTYQQYPTVRKTDSCECSFATFQNPNLGMLLWYPQSVKPANVLNFVQHRYCICLVVKFPVQDRLGVHLKMRDHLRNSPRQTCLLQRGIFWDLQDWWSQGENPWNIAPPPPPPPKKKHAVWEKTLRERITKRIPKNINTLKGH